MSITNITPRESELQKQVIELAESLRNLGWEFELYKTGARNTHQKLLDEIRELKTKLAEVPMTTVPNPRVIEIYDTCDQHPDAPHGYLRDASHNAGRYVCECEFWTPGEEL